MSELNEMLQEAQRAVEISSRDENYIEQLVPIIPVRRRERHCDVCHYSFYGKFYDYDSRIWCAECWDKRNEESLEIIAKALKHWEKIEDYYIPTIEDIHRINGV